jgi:DNA-binding cell septation regulator SpoVG
MWNFLYEGNKGLLGIIILVGLFIVWQKNINYLEYECIREDDLTKDGISIVKFYKENIVYDIKPSDISQRYYVAYPCERAEKADYYDIRVCGNTSYKINLQDLTYTSFNDSIQEENKGVCKKKNFFTRLAYPYEDFMKDKVKQHTWYIDSK